MRFSSDDQKEFIADQTLTMTRHIDSTSMLPYFNTRSLLIDLVYIFSLINFYNKSLVVVCFTLLVDFVMLKHFLFIKCIKKKKEEPNET